jgi:hypothetical protein
MKATLRWRRLEKPRGGWRFGLEFYFRVEYSEEERDALKPDWVATVEADGATTLRAAAAREDAAKTSIPFKHGKRGDFHFSTESGKVKVYPCTLAEKTVFFDSEQERDRFVTFLQKIVSETVRVAEDWWSQNPPVPGDEQESVVMAEANRG